MRKRNAPFIVWTSAPAATEDQVVEHERVLISAFRPGNNIQRSSKVIRSKETDQLIVRIDQAIADILRPKML
jgi:hypothetical protein